MKCPFCEKKMQVLEACSRVENQTKIAYGCNCKTKFVIYLVLFKPIKEGTLYHLNNS